jgi:hypothetical protein
MATEPWGWTATIYITIEGNLGPPALEAVAAAAKAAADRIAAEGFTVDYGGAEVSVVDEKPIDQVAT